MGLPCSKNTLTDPIKNYLFSAENPLNKTNHINMILTELLQKVREQNLTKTRLEELYTEFLELYSQMELRLGVIEKQEALFMDAHKEESVAAGERLWRPTALGLEMIELKRQNNVVKMQLSAVRHRIYSHVAY